MPGERSPSSRSRSEPSRRGTRASHSTSLRGWLSSASACFSASVPSRRKRAGIVEHQRRMLAAAHGERLGVAEVDDHVAVLRVVGLVGQPAEPSERFAAVRHACVPEAHRREMRQAGMLVAAAMDDRQQAVLVQPLEADHRRMESEAIGNLDDLRVPESPASASPDSTPGRRRGRPCSVRHCRPTTR